MPAHIAEIFQDKKIIMICVCHITSTYTKSVPNQEFFGGGGRKGKIYFGEKILLCITEKQLSSSSWELKGKSCSYLCFKCWSMRGRRLHSLNDYEKLLLQLFDLVAVFKLSHNCRRARELNKNECKCIKQTNNCLHHNTHAIKT